MVTTDLAVARAHAEACGTVVIEEFLDGPEVSLFALADGFTAVPLLAAQDLSGPRTETRDRTPADGRVCPAALGATGLADEVLATVIQPPSMNCAAAHPLPRLLYAG